MKCPKCNGEFNPPQGMSIANCPFCQEALVKPANPQKCTTMSEALGAISSAFGRDILLKPERLRAYIADYLPDGKVERNILGNLFKAGIPGKIDAACGKLPQEQQQLAVRFVNQLKDDFGLDKEAAANVLWALAETLGWSKRPVAEIAPEQESTPTPAPVVETQRAERRVEAQSVNVGDVISFGEFNWRVLDVQDGKALIISEEVIENKAYFFVQSDITWEECELRDYLNGEFYNSFGQTEKSRIAEIRIDNPNNPWCGKNGGNATNDRIFLLSLDEVCRYFGDSITNLNKDHHEDNISDRNDAARIAKDSRGKTSMWWLRSPGFHSDSAAFVCHNGSVNVYGYSVDTDDGGVRPALWLKLGGSETKAVARETASQPKTEQGKAASPSFKKVAEIFIEEFGFDYEFVRMEADLVDDLGVDLGVNTGDVIQLVAAFREELDVEMTEDDFVKMRTVGDVCTYIDKFITSR